MPIPALRTLLGPFAMRSAFPASDYYGPSAPSHSPPSTVDLARRRPRLGQLVGRLWDGSHVHQQFGRQDRRPAMPLQPRREYAAGLPRGLPTGYAFRLRSHRTTLVGRCALLPGPDPPDSSRFQSLRGFNHRFTPVAPCLPRLPDPAHLAVLDRPGVVRAASHPTGAPPPARLPSASPDCCDSPAVGPSTPPESLAPRGARRSHETDPAWRCQPCR